MKQRSPIRKLSEKRLKSLNGKPVFSTIAPSGKGVKRKKRTKPDFARIYHSKTRVGWVKGLPCVWCLARGNTQNAHTVGDGMGRKAGYATIAPLCVRCHFDYDNHLAPFNYPASRAFIRLGAQATNDRWLEHTEATK